MALAKKNQESSNKAKMNTVETDQINGNRYSLSTMIR